MAVNDAVLAPKHEQRTGDFAPRRDIGIVVLEIDRRRRAVVLARGMNGFGLRKASLVFCKGAGIEDSG